MTKVFISYRRDDARYPAARLHAALKPHVDNPHTDIFIDVDNIPAGVDFIAHLEGRVAECDVLLAVIGPGWLDLRDPQTGARRLDNPHDLVRIEIATALKRDIPVVPVLLDGVLIPPSESLPDDLRALSRRNGVPVRHESFEHDVARLVERLPVALKTVETSVPPKPRRPARLSPTRETNTKIPPLTTALAVGGIALAGFIFVANTMWTRTIPPETIQSEAEASSVPTYDDAAADAAAAAIEAASGGAVADMAYALGDQAYYSQDFAAAKQHFEEACNGGMARGCSDLGLLYERGFGVPVNPDEARRLYVKGCDGADTFGCERLRDLDLSLGIVP